MDVPEKRTKITGSRFRSPMTSGSAYHPMVTAVGVAASKALLARHVPHEPGASLWPGWEGRFRSSFQTAVVTSTVSDPSRLQGITEAARGRTRRDSEQTDKKRHPAGMRGVLTNRRGTAETPSLDVQGRSVSQKNVAEMPLAGLSYRNRFQHKNSPTDPADDHKKGQ